MSAERPCDHVWERRARLDARNFLRFACRRCGVLARCTSSPLGPIVPYTDEPASAPAFDGADDERRIFSDRDGFARWRGPLVGRVTLRAPEVECGVVAAGVKHDAGKPRLDLLPWGAVLACADALTYGAERYGEGNWTRLHDGKRRFLAASLRHIVAYARGEWLDSESGLPHLGHAIASLMFVFELAERDGTK